MLDRRSLLLLAVLSLPDLAKADEFPLAALMARLAAVPERRAAFQETRRFAALNAPLISRGRLFYRRPNYFEKVTDWPQAERLVVDGPWLSLSDSTEAPRVIDLRGQPELRAMVDGLRAPLAGDLALLSQQFQLLGAGSISAWTLELSPRGDRAARFLRSLQLAGREDWVSEIRLLQANGDEQVMQIGPPA